MMSLRKLLDALDIAGVEFIPSQYSGDVSPIQPADGLLVYYSGKVYVSKPTTDYTHSCDECAFSIGGAWCVAESPLSCGGFRFHYEEVTND